MKSFADICKDALYQAHNVLEGLKAKGAVEVHAQHVTDISTRGDMAISNFLMDFFEKQRIPAIIYSEESGKKELVKKPKYTITFDDLDGTDNYYRGRGLLPYCTVVTFFDSPKPNFEDAIAAGILEHNSRRLWYAERGKGCFLNDIKVNTSKIRKLDRRTLIIIDHYAGCESIQKFLDIYPNSWVKDFGSAALHLAGVSSGLFDAFLSSSGKAHELGAGYLLIKEAEGFLSDWSGSSLDKTVYNFNEKYLIIAASTPELGKTLLSKLK